MYIDLKIIISLEAKKFKLQLNGLRKAIFFLLFMVQERAILRWLPFSQSQSMPLPVQSTLINSFFPANCLKIGHSLQLQYSAAQSKLSESFCDFRTIRDDYYLLLQVKWPNFVKFLSEGILGNFVKITSKHFFYISRTIKGTLTNCTLLISLIPRLFVDMRYISVG